MKEFIINELKTLNIIDEDKLLEYVDLCLNCNLNKHIKKQTENHHILPKSIFPNFQNLFHSKWNGTNLSYENHFKAHELIALAIDNNSLIYAWNCMRTLNKKINFNMNSKEYKILRERHFDIVSNLQHLRNRKQSIINKRRDTMNKIGSDGLNGFERQGKKISKVLKENKSLVKEKNPMFNLVHVKERENPNKKLSLNKNYNKLKYTHHKTKFIKLISKEGTILFEGWADELNCKKLNIPYNVFCKLENKICYTNDYVKRLLVKRNLEEYIESQLIIIKILPEISPR